MTADTNSESIPCPACGGHRHRAAGESLVCLACDLMFTPDEPGLRAEVKRLRAQRDALIRRHYGPFPFGEGMWKTRDRNGFDHLHEDHQSAKESARILAEIDPPPAGEVAP